MARGGEQLPEPSAMDRIEREAAEVAATLPARPRLAVLGSSAFWHTGSASLCGAVGRRLAEVDGLVLLTGGVPGVGEAVGRAFDAARRGRNEPSLVYHVLPRGAWPWDYGTTLFAGEDMAERREVLGRLAEVYVVVEGGPGTAHEASVARKRSALVLPMGGGGGHAAELWGHIGRPAVATGE